jgi:hypothetical protein
VKNCVKGLEAGASAHGLPFGLLNGQADHRDAPAKIAAMGCSTGLILDNLDRAEGEVSVD